MSAASKVLNLIQDEEIEFVDLRFADMLGKHHHVTFPAHQIEGAGPADNGDPAKPLADTLPIVWRGGSAGFGGGGCSSAGGRIHRDAGRTNRTGPCRGLCGDGAKEQPGIYGIGKSYRRHQARKSSGRA